MESYNIEDFRDQAYGIMSDDEVSYTLSRSAEKVSENIEEALQYICLDESCFEIVDDSRECIIGEILDKALESMEEVERAQEEFNGGKVDELGQKDLVRIRAAQNAYVKTL